MIRRRSNRGLGTAEEAEGANESVDGVDGGRAVGGGNEGKTEGERNREREREREREKERKRLATTPRERRGNDVLNASRRPRRRRRWEGGRKGREGAKKNSMANIFVEGKGKIYPQPTPRIQKKTFKRSGSRVSALGDFFFTEFYLVFRVHLGRCASFL